MDIRVQPIGFVRGGRVEALDDGWDAETAVIELDPERVDPSATTGLDAFSHVEEPHMTGFDAQGEVREPAWAQEIMRDYW